MLTLYIKTGCPYCKRVLDTIDELGISVNQRNIDDEGVEAELVARGGKRQMPYLADEKEGIEMYESEDIVRYLTKHYGV